MIVAIAAVTLAGCNTMYSHIGDEAVGFGEAERYDAAVQTINPTPVYSATGAQPGDNGDVGAHAVKRYRSGAVIPTQSLGTTGGSTGGGPQ
jgi:hypothetical protein